MPHAQQRLQQQQQQQVPVGPMGKMRWLLDERLGLVRARQQGPQHQQAPAGLKKNSKGSWQSDERLEWIRQVKQLQQQQLLLKKRWQSVWARAGRAPSLSAGASAETTALLHHIDMTAARLIMRNNDDACVSEEDRKSLDKRMEKRRKVNVDDDGCVEGSVSEGEVVARAKARVEANSDIVVIDDSDEEKSKAGGGIPPSHAQSLSHETGITSKGDKMNEDDSASDNSQMKVNAETSANAETAKPSNGAIVDETENAKISVNRARVTSETEPPVTHASNASERESCAFCADSSGKQWWRPDPSNASPAWSIISLDGGQVPNHGCN